MRPRQERQRRLPLHRRGGYNGPTGNGTPNGTGAC